jgi:Zn-dependent protease
MLRSWQIGRFFGIAVYIHWTFVLLFGWVLASAYKDGWSAALDTAALVLAVFGCVLLHEFGHALMARCYGLRTRDITLYPIGGVARLELLNASPLEELFIALAGPLVNMAIALFLAVLLLAQGDGPIVLLDVSSPATGGIDFVRSLLLLNLGLAFFNLLPAFPMDGGRVLRSLLALLLGRVRATVHAVRLGMVLALVMILLPVILSLVGLDWNPILVLLGLFVFFAGQRELQLVRHADASPGEEPLEDIPVEEEAPEDQPASTDWPGQETRSHFDEEPRRHPDAQDKTVSLSVSGRLRVFTSSSLRPEGSVLPLFPPRSIDWAGPR